MLTCLHASMHAEQMTRTPARIPHVHCLQKQPEKSHGKFYKGLNMLASDCFDRLHALHPACSSNLTRDHNRRPKTGHKHPLDQG